MGSVATMVAAIRMESGVTAAAIRDSANTDIAFLMQRGYNPDQEATYMGCMKRILCCLLIIAGSLLLCASTGLAAFSMDFDWDLFEKAEISDGLPLPFPQDANLPVYSAPDESAFRGADGKARVSLGESFRVLATAEHKSWWLIEYDVSDRAKRVGWIRIKKDRPAASHPSIYDWLSDQEDAWAYDEAPPDVEELEFSELGEVLEQTALTDDPRGEQRTLCMLEKGKRIGLLFKEHLPESGDWVYIITETNGQTVCGFVPANRAAPVRESHLEGKRLIIEEGIEFLGDTVDWLDSNGIEYKDGGPVQAAARFGMIHYSMPQESYEVTGEYQIAEEVQLPSTLKLLGDDALFGLRLESLVVPEGVVSMRGLATLFNMQIGTLYLPSTLRDFEYCVRCSVISRYEVAEENPFYKSVDGVVFSKDGKTLFCYPAGKPDRHYTIPKGTENIHAYAFCSYPFYDYDMPPVPLLSLTMPIGLKRIGARSLTGLQELVSLVIPPTVEEIGPYALGPMASLSRFSIPEHLRGMIGEDWFIAHERKNANGDNGNLTEKRGDEPWE